MSDIDEELKHIQLQRERLALERELSRRALKTNAIAALAGGAGAVGAVFSGITGAVLVVFRGVGRFVRATWKWAAVAAVVGIAVMVKAGIDRGERNAQARATVEAQFAQEQAAAQVRAQVADQSHARLLAGEQAAARVRAQEAVQAQAARESAAAQAKPAPGLLEVWKDANREDFAREQATDATKYVVEAGSYTDAATLTAVRRQIEQGGHKTYTQVLESEGRTRSRVRIGPFDTAEQAQAVADQLRAVGLPGAVTRL